MSRGRGQSVNVVFAAVSNPTRRKILDMLRERERPAGDLADAFSSLPQPAVSRHLKVLREAGLVNVSSLAQRRIYSLNPERLRELDAWVSHYRDFWPERLDSLARHLDRTYDGVQGRRGRRP